MNVVASLAPLGIMRGKSLETDFLYSYKFYNSEWNLNPRLKTRHRSLTSKILYLLIILFYKGIQNDEFILQDNVCMIESGVLSLQLEFQYN